MGSRFPPEELRKILQAVDAMTLVNIQEGVIPLIC
jgi:hypothetical protein